MKNVSSVVHLVVLSCAIALAGAPLWPAAEAQAVVHKLTHRSQLSRGESAMARMPSTQAPWRSGNSQE